MSQDETKQNEINSSKAFRKEEEETGREGQQERKDDVNGDQQNYSAVRDWGQHPQ